MGLWKKKKTGKIIEGDKEKREKNRQGKHATATRPLCTEVESVGLTPQGSCAVHAHFSFRRDFYQSALHSAGPKNGETLSQDSQSA